MDDHPRAATKLREIMVTRLLLAAAALSCAAPGAAFMGNAPSFGLRRASVSQRAGACSLRAQAQVGETVLGRRDVLKAPVAASLAAAISFAASPAPVRAEDTLDSPIVVFGAGGGTGAACVEYCSVTAEIPCRAVRRAAVTSKGKETAFPEVDASLLAVAQGDVTDPKSVAEAVKGARAVIFAASASKKGGDPEAVDYKGLLNVAKACIDAKVPRLVVVSSGAVSKPDSAIYQLLNLFGKIMYWKKKGEDEMIAMYKASGDDSLSYTIVRPGGLSDEAGQVRACPPIDSTQRTSNSCVVELISRKSVCQGPKAMELNQGDEKSGKISRADVSCTLPQHRYI